MAGEKIWEVYFRNYRKFLFIPFIILVISVVLISVKVWTTGDFIEKDVSLKGGISLTVLDESPISIKELEYSLKGEFSPYSVSIRLLKSAGSQIGILIESDIPELSQEKADSVLSIISQKLGKQMASDNYSLETMGSSLGRSFFTQTFQALILAFVFMGIVVFLYFRTIVPSAAVILSALSDIIVTVAVINILGIKIGTAGIAALLMLIGYSVDTDMLLTTRVLKRKETSLQDAVKGAFKTGMTMTLTTIAAVTIGLFFTQSDVIRQIMSIILIGLVIDIINTWVQNTGLLMWYVENKSR